MRRRLWIWAVLGLLAVIVCCVWLGNKSSRHFTPEKATVTKQEATNGSSMALLSKPSTTTTNANVNLRLAHRLHNTTKTVGQLVKQDQALLLENALIDTRTGGTLAVPDRLRAKGDHGSYIVQAKGPIDDSFRILLAQAGAKIVAYIPNNAYLVRVSAQGAEQMRASAETQTVLAYEPYFKIKSSLLGMAINNEPLPDNTKLNILLFADGRDGAVNALKQMGAEILDETTSPFGPVIYVKAGGKDVAAIADLAGVQEIEKAHARKLANDLIRETIGVAADSVVPDNYLNLSGTNIIVNVNDSGVDTNHPDLSGRVLVVTNDPLGGYDTVGHGTHVAGIIASSGGQSMTVSNAQGSILPPVAGQFRGMAPGSKIFSMNLDLTFGSLGTDRYLQQTAAQTNALISNNSWHFFGDNGYGLGAASYDAAVRDALPEVTGSQPVAYVFAVGNGGAMNVWDDNVNDDGNGGSPDDIASPATAKNVITVGAIESLRNITNDVWKCTVTGTNGTPVCATNKEWQTTTDASDQVARFSNRGNVGIGFDGDFGRFKPDVVAPGSAIVSTRSTVWDEETYYNPTNHHFDFIGDPPLVLDTKQFFANPLFIPDNAVAATIEVFSPVDMPIFVKIGDIATPTNYDFVGTNIVQMPGDHALTPVGLDWFYAVLNTSTQLVSFTIETDITTTNDHGNFLQVLSNMNNTLGPFYRYESGSSMAAASVSGTMALMQEFFVQRLQRTNSPALLKAMLINGARSVGDLYDFQVQSGINYQGWGLINLPNSLPGVLSNLTSSGSAPSSMYVFDQGSTNALATGEQHTRFFSIKTAAQAQPLRVTLVWTDPPGNPAASIKLVNGLDLVVTNLQTKEVFFGNDILGGNDFNLAWDTNGMPNIDLINNVENVYLQPDPRLGTNYSVTVKGRRVNVNAVSTHTNGVVQDYALVVSSGDGTIPDALTITDAPTVSSNALNITYVTNGFTFSSDTSGAFLLYNRVGASSPLQGLNYTPLAGGLPGQITDGVTNQWHFFVVSNDFNFTNAAFVTFLPPNLSLPRMGVFEDTIDNATRIEADIELYVSKDPNLTNLTPAAIAAADKSIGRGGTEFIVYSNASPQAVYYVGIKSEDQEAAEFGFLGIFSELPFASQDQMGNVILRGLPVPSPIPDGTPTHPGVAYIFAIAPEPIQIRRVVVTNTITHELMGDLLGNLSHNHKFVVLNNHTCQIEPVSGNCFTNYTFIYEDNGEGNVPGSRPSDGPGSLKTFTGEEGSGPWILTMVDNAQNHTGMVQSTWIRLEPQNITNGTPHDVLPNTFAFDFIDVPIEATNLTVCVSGNTAPVELYVKRGDFPTRTDYDKKLIVNPVSLPQEGCMTINATDIPPLNPGTYYIGVFNPSGSIQTIRIHAFVDLDLAAIVPIKYDGIGPIPILDDAVTYSSVMVTNFQKISDIEVGLRIDHPRVSDCVFTLISPSGTRVLLCENRGGLTTSGMGSGQLITNVFPATVSGGPAANTNILNVGQNQGSLIIDYQFFGEPDFMHVYYDNALIFDSGFVSGGGRFAIDFGPGTATDITIIMNEGGNNQTNPPTAWNYTATVVSGDFQYLTFTENTNKAKVPIKFAIPPFVGATNSGSTAISGFELPPPGDYANPQGLDGWNVVDSNIVRVVNDPTGAQSGSQYLSLFHGSMTRSMPTVAAQNYTLSYYAKSATNCFNFSNFNTAQGLTLTGIAAPVGGVLRLTPAAGNTSGTAWYKDKVQCAAGFDTRFHFRFSNIGGDGGGDGITFNVQNQAANDTELSGSFTPATKFVTVYFNTFWNWPSCTDFTICDVSDNSIGVLINATYLAQIDLNPLGINMSDGAIHEAHITYDGTNMTVRLDNVLMLNNIPVPGLSPGVDSCGEGWVGFTALTGAAWENQDILDWQFCSQAPSPVADVYIPGVLTNSVTGGSSWAAHSLSFTAQSNSTPLGVSPEGCTSSMLLDTFTLNQSGGGLFYFPEESLKKLIGEDAYGEWKLEVVDDRAGATNPQPQIVRWQLRFRFENNIPAANNLVSGTPVTNSIPPGAIGYYLIDVPDWASFATNQLVYVNGGTVNLLFNQFIPPTGTGLSGDFTLLANVAAAAVGTPILSTNTTPTLIPGARYYLGVQNTGVTPVTVGVQVDFDITPLTNMIPVASAIPVNGLQRYFSYNVSTNATAVTFQLLNLSGDVSLVASKGFPVPTVSAYDYASFNLGTNDEEIIIFKNSTPVPLSPGEWYLGVFNSDTNNVNYTILATEYTNPFPTIITLFNAIPYANTNSGTNIVVGGATNDYYLFQVSTNAVRAQFEINNPSADMTLVARKGLPLPDLSSYSLISTNPGISDELIVIFDYSQPVRLTAGDWFLTAVNVSGGPVSYSIKATEFTVYATNIVITGWSVVSNSFCFSWTSVPGVHYFVQGLTDLSSTNWVTISPTITASAFVTTYCVPLPSIYHFFRVGEGLSPLTSNPATIGFTSIVRQTNGVLLQWTAPTNYQFKVQWTPFIPTASWNTFTNIITSTNGQFSFLDDGSQSGGFTATRFYRLLQLVP